MLQRLDTDSTELSRIATRVRLHALEMIARKGKGHLAPSLSIADIVSALYFSVLRVDPDRPFHPDRDRFILSKGHGCAALYGALAERGFFPRERLGTYYELDSQLAGHPVAGLPGIEVATGSLGHGLSLATGVALAGRIDCCTHRIITLLGDGECQEGSIWEAAMCASHFELDNLTAIVDRNRLSVDGWTEELMHLEPFGDRWRSFGWEVRVADGHSPGELTSALRAAPWELGRPSVLLALTTKGKGIDFIENQPEWHSRAPTAEQTAIARQQLESQLAGLSAEVER